MKAAVLFGPGDVRVTDFPQAALKPGDVKISVAYCGLCGTDFHKFAGKAGSRPVTYPVPLGHEISGVVTEVGEDVSDFKAGDRVTADPNWSCGRCYWCQRGLRHLCSNSRGVVKGMAQYVCVPQENVYHLPDRLSLRDAALTEPLSCCLHGMELLDMKMGDCVAIIGMGAIGQLMLQLCVHSAANTIIIETDEEKRKTALELGAGLFINPLHEDVEDVIRRANISCVNRVMECGGLPATAEMALKIAGRGATVVLFGVSDAEAVVPLHQYDAFSKELIIKTSYINPAATGRAIGLLAAGAIDTEHIVSRVIELEELPEELKTRRYSRRGKVLVRVAGG